MGMLRAVTLAFLATWALGAAPASADGEEGGAGPYLYAPEAPPPGFFDFHWTGFYAGAHLGGGHTDFEAVENDRFDPLFPITDTYSQDSLSVVGGVQAGWQKQWEKLVAGIEVGYTALSFDETKESVLILDLERSAEVRDLFILAGRLGYADGRWLAYAKGGWVSADIDVSYRDTLTGAVTSSGDRESGWTAGVGIDYALTYNLFLGVEYNYLHFNTDVPVPPVPAVDVSDADVDIQTLVVRLNYRFGGPVGCDWFSQACH